MSVHNVYSSVDEDSIIKSVAKKIEELLETHYFMFQMKLFGGVLIIFFSIFAAFFNHNLAGLLFILGLALIVKAFAGRVYIEEADVASYPVIAVPYGDGTEAILIDPLGSSGHNMVLSIPRVDLTSGKLIGYKTKLNEVYTQFQTFGEDLNLKDLVKIGKEGIFKTSFEEKVETTMEELLKVIKDTPVEQFNFKLFRAPHDVSIYSTELVNAGTLMGKDATVVIEENILKTSSLLRALNVNYIALLEEIQKAVESVKKLMESEYYGELTNQICRVNWILKHVVNDLKANVCPQCFVTAKEKILTGSGFPLISKKLIDVEKSVIKYICTRCGFIYEEPMMCINEVDHRPSQGLPKVYYIDTIESKVWNRTYVSKVNEINKYVNKARMIKKKRQQEVIRRINNYLNQFRAITVPIYIEATRLTNEIAANKSLLDTIGDSSLIPTNLFCVGDQLKEEADSIKKELEKAVDVESKLSNILRELDEISKIKTNMIFSETSIATLIESYKLLGQSDIAEQLYNSYNKRSYDDLERLIRGVNK